MKNLLPFVFIVFSFPGFSQLKNNMVKISSGYQVFGTGDVPGYSIKIEYANRIAKKSKRKYGQVFIGPEISFESGVKNPKIFNPTLNEFISKSFNHLTTIVLSAKASYYPFKKVLPGLNLCAAPSIGYSQESREIRASLINIGNGQTMRSSYLSFNNQFVFGYRIITGYDVSITEKMAAGILIQLANYDNGDFNSFFGVNFALNF